MLEDCVRRGVLEQTPDGELSFGHLTYQEFLAAVYLIERNDRSIIWQHLSDAWWWQTLVFYASKIGDITGLVEKGLHREVTVKDLERVEQLMKLAPYTDRAAADQLRKRLLVTSSAGGRVRGPTADRTSRRLIGLVRARGQSSGEPVRATTKRLSPRLEGHKGRAPLDGRLAKRNTQKCPLCGSSSLKQQLVSDERQRYFCKSCG